MDAGCRAGNDAGDRGRRLRQQSVARLGAQRFRRVQHDRDQPPASPRPSPSVRSALCRSVGPPLAVYLMAWSHDFLAYIEGDRRAEVWLVEVYQSGSEPGADGYTMSSCAGYGDEVRIAGPPRISGGRVTPVAWSSTIGACSIPLVGPLTT